MNELQIIQWLWRFGHFASPINPDGPNVAERDLPKLTLRDEVVVRAAESIQRLDANLDHLVSKHHDRAVIFDGHVGPATTELLQMPRCGCPDYSLDQATGNGSWPIPGCDEADQDREKIHSIRVNIDTSRMPQRVRDYWQQVEDASRDAYQDMGLRVRYVLDGDPRQSEISKKFEFLSGGVIGWNEFPSAGTCRQTIDGRLDTDYQPSDYVMFALLEIHETGHGVRLDHTRGGIMNPSIMRTPMSWRGDPHESTMRRFFGGVPVGLGDDEPDPPDPDPPPEDPDVGIPWKELIELVLVLIRECRDDGASRETIHAEFRDPGRFAKLRFERKVRKHLGLNGWRNRRTWLSRRDEVMEPIYAIGPTATDADIDGLIDDTED